jgi:hypothetical protein
VKVREDLKEMKMSLFQENVSGGWRFIPASLEISSIQAKEKQ